VVLDWDDTRFFMAREFQTYRSAKQLAHLEQCQMSWYGS
jgi:hypothetical protein